MSRLVRKTLSFSKSLENHIGAIWYFIHHYNASFCVALLRGILAQINESGMLILVLLAQTLQTTLTHAAVEKYFREYYREGYRESKPKGEWTPERLTVKFT